MTTAFMEQPAVRTLYGIPPTTPNDAFESVFAKASPTSIFFYVVAFAIHILERIFDTETDRLVQYVESMRPHTKLWYINKLRTFQLGYSINEDGGYDTVDVEAQIIKYASLRIKGGELYFLIATDDNGVPKKISDSNILTSIRSYAERVFDAGVHFKIFSDDADTYRCRLLINYDPLVLDTEGRRLDGTNDTPVEDAVSGYFRSFPFDSEFSNMALVDAIQKVEGVRVAELTESKAKTAISGSSFIAIESTYIANAGYMAYDAIGSEITYTI